MVGGGVVGKVGGTLVGGVNLGGDFFLRAFTAIKITIIPSPTIPAQRKTGLIEGPGAGEY